MHEFHIFYSHTECKLFFWNGTNSCSKLSSGGLFVIEDKVFILLVIQYSIVKFLVLV